MDIKPIHGKVNVRKGGGLVVSVQLGENEKKHLPLLGTRGMTRAYDSNHNMIQTRSH